MTVTSSTRRIQPCRLLNGAEDPDEPEASKVKEAEPEESEAPEALVAPDESGDSPTHEEAETVEEAVDSAEQRGPAPEAWSRETVLERTVRVRRA